jgi:hypothetical protein
MKKRKLSAMNMDFTVRRKLLRLLAPRPIASVAAADAVASCSGGAWPVRIDGEQRSGLLMGMRHRRRQAILPGFQAKFEEQ